MPVAILLIGILLLVTVYKGNTTEVFAQVETDILGDGSSPGFMLWVGAILFLAAAGSILGLQKTSKLFIGLVLAVFILKQNGLWTKVESALTSAQKPAATTPVEVGAAVDALDKSGGSGATATASAGSGATGAGSAVASGVAAGASILSTVMKGFG